MRRDLIGFVVAVSVLGLAAPAAAGGWWSNSGLRTKYLAPGDELVLRTEAFFRTMEQAETAATTPYYAYLVSDYDRALLRKAMSKATPRRWWAPSPGAELIKIGRTTIDIDDSNVGTARTRIKVPAGVDSGRYSFMLCDEGCVTPMGHSIPAPVRVVTGAGVAQFHSRIARLSDRLTRLQDLGAANRELSAAERREMELEIFTLRRRLNETSTGAQDTARQADDLQQSVEELGAKVELLEAEQSAVPTWAWVLGGLLAAAVALLGIVARRRRRDVAEPDLLDDDLDGGDWERARTLAGAGRSRHS